MILGAVLLGAELLVVDAAFYLVFLGVAAAITGAAVLLGIGMELWVQWLLFGSLSLIAMVTFRQRLYAKLRGNVPDYGDGLGGEIIRLTSDLPAGSSCRHELRGTMWTVINRSPNDIQANTEVSITEVQGLNLVIK
jgi:membrane protein implicated in regulation of membrane protease activity